MNESTMKERQRRTSCKTERGLDGGETNGYDRLPFLDTGIVDILAKATGGVGVVLEHR